MSSKEDNFKEQFKQALISTAKVISEDYKPDNKKLDKKTTSKKINFFDITNLSNKNDFVKLRAETDSSALKKKFSDKKIFNKNSPKNPSCKNLYTIAEKVRYEILGGRMLKGIKKNLDENYNQKIISNRKEHLKSKDDVTVADAFELYMLKKFFNIKLNSVSSKMLSFWEKEFNESIGKYFNFLNENLENQNNYSLKFTEILEGMDIFNSNTEEDNKDDDNEENKQDNKTENNEDNQSDEEDENNKQDEAQTSLDAGFDLSDQPVDENLENAESFRENKENIPKKINSNNIDQEYKIFTSNFDEIAKAETLENLEEIQKLRKNLDQQLIGFQDLITNLQINYKDNFLQNKIELGSLIWKKVY